jgi:hypothetical protein
MRNRHMIESRGATGLRRDCDSASQLDGTTRSAELHTQPRGGTALDTGARSRFENVLGHSLADVRVHTDAVSDELARKHDARALTIGHDIFLRAGQPAVTSLPGLRLLAHEAAHVVQQDLAASTAPDALAEIPSLRHEAEAHRVASTVSGDATTVGPGSDAYAAGPVVTAAPAGTSMQRWPWDDEVGDVAAGLWEGAVSAGSSAVTIGDAFLAGNGTGGPDFGVLNKALGDEVDEDQDMVRWAGKAATEATADIPILGDIVEAGALVSDVGVEAVGGSVKGAGDIASSTANALMNPMNAVTGLLEMGEHDPGLAGYLFKGAHGVFDIATGNEEGKYGSTFGELWDNLTDVDKQNQDDLDYWSQLGGGQKAWENEPIEAASRTATNLAPLILGTLAEAGFGRGAGGEPPPEVKLTREAKAADRPIEIDFQNGRGDPAPVRSIKPGDQPGLLSGVADWFSDLFKGSDEPPSSGPPRGGGGPKQMKPTRTMDQIRGSRRNRGV